jgi:hypothetical protein
MLGLPDNPAAPFLDKAVYLFGTAMEKDLEDRQAGKKTAGAKKIAESMWLQAWLGVQQFR